MTLATTTTIQAPLEETLAFVSYHLQCGVDRMYLFFDDPEDEAFPVLQDHAQLTCVLCDDTHWTNLGVEDISSVQNRQRANATYAFRWAEEEGIDWVVHIDSDELLRTPKPANKYFSMVSSGVDVVLLPVMEAVPQGLQYHHPFRDINLFKYFPRVRGDNSHLSMISLERGRYWIHSQLWRRKKQVATALGCDHSQIVGRYLLGHMAGKSATRTTANVAGIENHRPVPNSGEVLGASVATDAAVLHFDCRGFAQWKVKWARRVNGTVDFDISRFSPHRRRQLRVFRDAYSQENERALRDLYRRWYFMSDRERSILRTLGLVKKIDLSPSLFDIPTRT